MEMDNTKASLTILTHARTVRPSHKPHQRTIFTARKAMAMSLGLAAWTCSGFERAA